MPIRVPQASLAPQLRRSQREQDTEPRETGKASKRSPEAMRNILISMQQGWERGRLDDLDNPGGAPGEETD
jgi:hypothetical protein